MNASGQIRWGVLGTGAMASDFVRALATAPGAAVAAVGSRDGGRANAFAAAHGIARAHASHDALLADRDVDVVYVATINSTHRDLCLRALDAGKPVLCEKPFACTAAEAREIVARARARRLFCMEGMWTRHLPAVQQARAAITGGAIGEPRLFAAHVGYAHAVDAASRLFDPAQGGGALLDLGIYPLSLAAYLLGPVTGVHGAFAGSGTGVDASVTMTLTHAGGRLSVLSASLVSAAPNEGVVMGSTGRLVLHAPLVRPEAFSVERVAPSAPRAHGSTGGLRDSAIARTVARLVKPVLARLRGGGARRTAAPALGNGYAHEAIEVMRCLRDGLLESPVVPLDESVALLEVMDRLRATWNDGRGGN